jgi:phosphoenolpyruvate carboxykinase (GTP)
MHFPDEHLVWSIGSGYGGNALLGKKCFSLRIASWLGLKEGWLAEHMVIVGAQDPSGDTTYIAAALPSACGKTNLAMMESALPGYKIWTVGDDIAWLNIGDDGRLWAINPETGFFGVAPGTSMKTNPNMMRTLKKGTFYPTLFTNTALNTDTNEPWWEGMDGPVPENVMDWQGKRWDRASGAKAAHPNSRFTTSAYQCPTLSPLFDNPKGAPISAILFGSKRMHLNPLIVEGMNWSNNVFLGARMGSETTAAASHKEGVVRRDPMAMLPFCGYNIADYFKHWLNIEPRLVYKPRVFSVNWFRTDENGRYLWPGFSHNSRVLKWVIDRVHGRVDARETPIGFLPDVKDLDLSGLNIPAGDLEKLFVIDKDGWLREAADIEDFFKKFGSHMPREMWDELEAMRRKLSDYH